MDLIRNRHVLHIILGQGFVRNLRVHARVYVRAHLFRGLASFVWQSRPFRARRPPINLRIDTSVRHSRVGQGQLSSVEHVRAIRHSNCSFIKNWADIINYILEI